MPLLQDPPASQPESKSAPRPIAPQEKPPALTPIDPKIVAQGKDALDPSLQQKTLEQKQAEWRKFNIEMVDVPKPPLPLLPSEKKAGDEKLADLGDGVKIYQYTGNDSYFAKSGAKSYTVSVVVDDPNAHIKILHDKIIVTEVTAEGKGTSHTYPMNIDGKDPVFFVVETPKQGNVNIDLTEARGEEETRVSIRGGKANLKVANHTAEKPGTHKVVVTTYTADDITLEASPEYLQSVRVNPGSPSNELTDNAKHFTLYSGKQEVAVRTPAVYYGGEQIVAPQKRNVFADINLVADGHYAHTMEQSLHDVGKKAEKDAAEAIKKAQSKETGR